MNRAQCIDWDTRRYCEAGVNLMHLYEKAPTKPNHLQDFSRRVLSVIDLPMYCGQIRVAMGEKGKDMGRRLNTLFRHGYIERKMTDSGQFIYWRTIKAERLFSGVIQHEMGVGDD